MVELGMQGMQYSLEKPFWSKLTRFGQNWSEIWAKVIRFGDICLDLGKIDLLHPQKASISYSYMNSCLRLEARWFALFLFRFIIYGFKYPSNALVYLLYLCLINT